MSWRQYKGGSSTQHAGVATLRSAAAKGTTKGSTTISAAPAASPPTRRHSRRRCSRLRGRDAGRHGADGTREGAACGSRNVAAVPYVALSRSARTSARPPAPPCARANTAARRARTCGARERAARVGERGGKLGLLGVRRGVAHRVYGPPRRATVAQRDDAVAALVCRNGPGGRRCVTPSMIGGEGVGRMSASCV
jgi:hypothetical protein